MARIELNNELPGISGLLQEFPRHAKPLTDLAHELLRGPSPLSSGEREVIAAYVSARNGCRFCHGSHGATARQLLNEDAEVLDEALADLESSSASEKLKAFLRVADKVRESGLAVGDEDFTRARDAGAGDQELHDTVLIAAAFCMYNRYVDGLGTWAPEDPAGYTESAKRLAEHGYAR